MTATTPEPRTDWACPRGRLVLRADAARGDWLSARRAGIGGSDVATLAGANRYSNPFAIWQSKVDDPGDDEQSEAQWWGQHTEALTTDRFETITGLRTRRAGMYAHRDHAHHLVSVDRLVSDGGVLEVKDHEVLSIAGKHVLAGRITDHARLQLQWAMHVTGRSHGWFAAKVGKTTNVLGPIYPDFDTITWLVGLADGMWSQVQDRTPPPVDPFHLADGELAARFPTVIEADAAVEADVPDLVMDDLSALAAAKADIAAATARKAAIEDRLKAQIGDREYLTVAGRPVARWQQVAGRKSLDTKALDAAHPGLRDQYLKQGAPTRRLIDLTSKETQP